jgi:hypothetical protein
MTDQKDDATHASGKRDATRASSDAHRMAHSRDKTVGEADSDPQKLDRREAQAKARAMSRPPAEG